VVKAYLVAMGGWPAFVILMIGFLGAELFRVGATVWLSIWTGEEDDKPYDCCVTRHWLGCHDMFTQYFLPAAAGCTFCR
jgi:hypothetical protein